MLMCFYLFIESFLQNSSNYKTKLNYRVCNTSSTFFPSLGLLHFSFLSDNHLENISKM